MVEGCKPHWPDPTEIEHARRAMVGLVEAYDRALIPAGPDFAGRIFGLLAVAYPPAKLTDEEAELQLAVYVDALAQFPPDILAAATRRALTTSRFFPTIAELIQSGGEDSAVASLEHRVRMRNSNAAVIDDQPINLADYGCKPDRRGDVSAGDTLEALRRRREA